MAKKIGLSLTAFYVVIYAIIFSGDSLAQTPEPYDKYNPTKYIVDGFDNLSLDRKVDLMAHPDGWDDAACEYFAKLGPQVVPIITKKLLESLAEKVSAEVARESVLMQMPRLDEKRVNYQSGLVVLQSIALQKIPLSPEISKAAKESLYQALCSPYIMTRRDAIYFTALAGRGEAIAHILPLLNDPDEGIRDQAAAMLAKIGDKAAGDKIGKVLEMRRRGLTAEQIDKDGSFREGYKAMETLKDKPTPDPSPTFP